MYKGLWIAVPFDKRPNVAFGSCTNAKNYLAASEEGGEIWRGENVLEMYDHSFVHTEKAQPFTVVVPSYQERAETTAHLHDAIACNAVLVAILTATEDIKDMPTVERHDSVRLHLADVMNSLNAAIEIIRRSYEL